MTIRLRKMFRLAMMTLLSLWAFVCGVVPAVNAKPLPPAPAMPPQAKGNPNPPAKGNPPPGKPVAKGRNPSPTVPRGEAKGQQPGGPPGKK